MRYQKLDQILLEMGLVDENILGKAKELQRESGGQLDEVLIRMKQITEGQRVRNSWDFPSGIFPMQMQIQNCPLRFRNVWQSGWVQSR